MKLKLFLTIVLTLGFFTPTATLAMEEQRTEIELKAPEEETPMWVNVFAVALIAANIYVAYLCWCEYGKADQDLQGFKAEFSEISKRFAEIRAS